MYVMYRSSRIGTHILMMPSISVLCNMHESITNRLSSNLEGASCFSASAEKHLTEISPCTIGNSTTSTNCTSEIAQNRLTRAQTPLPKKTMSPFCTIPHSSTALFESSTALFQANFLARRGILRQTNHGQWALARNVGSRYLLWRCAPCIQKHGAQCFW